MGGLCSSGGGGSPAATSQTISTSNIAPWAQAGVTQLTQAGLQNIFPQYNQSTGVLGPQSGYTPFNANTAQQVDANGQPVNTGMNTAYQAGLANTAGFSDLQNQSFNAAQNMQLPGQYNAATGMAGQAGQGALGTTGTAGLYGAQGARYGQQAAGLAPQAQQYGANAANIGMQGLGYGAMGAGYGAMGANAGMSYGQNAQNVGGNASPSVQSYMNPYLQSTLAPSLQLLNQQYGMQQNANQGAATQAGAFGGSRMGVQNALNQQNQLLATNQLVGNAYNQAYNTANQNMQNAATLGIQGSQAGMQGAAAGQAGINSAIQGQQAGLSGIGQANATYGQGIAGAQTGLSGVNTAQQGYAGANTAAGTMANIGTQQLAGQQSIAGLQNAYGSQQQQQTQNVLNAGNQNYSTMQAYPMQQLQQMEGLYTGAPTNTTTSNYSAAPSTLSQVAGLGMAGYGLSQLGTGTGTGKAKGGRIKEGGIDKLPAKNLESFKEGGITGGRMEDGARRFDVAGPTTPTRPQTIGDILGANSRPQTLANIYGIQPQGPYVSPRDALMADTNRTSQNISGISQGLGATTPAAMPSAENAPGASPQSVTPLVAASASMPQMLNTKPMTPYQSQQAADQFYNDASGNVQMRLDNSKEELRKSIEQEDIERQMMLQNRPTLGKKQEERLNKDAEKDQGRLADLKAMSWLEQGLATLGGTSPFWSANIGTTKGIEAYKAGKKDLDKAEQLRQEAYSHIDDMRDARTNQDIDSELLHRERATDKVQHFNEVASNALNNFDMARAGAGLGVYNTGRTEAGANARANLGAQTQVGLANLAAQTSTNNANAQLQLQQMIHGGDLEAQKEYLKIQQLVDTEISRDGMNSTLDPASLSAKRTARMQEEIAKNPLLSRYASRMGMGLGSQPSFSSSPTGNVISSAGMF
jgi:hypothetical protein